MRSTLPSGEALRSSRIPMPVRRRLPRSCCSTAARFTSPDKSRHASVSVKRPATGWRWSASAGSRLPRRCLQFEYGGYTLNLLDTPGHQDFGEDTYRTLLSRRQRGDAHRRRQRRRAADEKAVCHLRRARHPALHVHEQARPAEPRSARAARRVGERLGHRRIPDELAARQRRELPRRVRPQQQGGASLRARRARRDACDRLGDRSQRSAAARARRRSSTSSSARRSSCSTAPASVSIATRCCAARRLPSFSGAP